MQTTTKQKTDHAEEEQLLLVFEGELSARDEKAIANHLHWCRECRVKRQTLREGLDALAEYGQAAGGPPKGWSEFPALLDRVAAADEYKSRTKAS